MKKRLNLDGIVDTLAEDMWGTVRIKTQYLPGLINYDCEYYEGFIFNDREFTIDKELSKKLKPITIIESYSFRGEKFILERTNRDEKVPKKILSKYNSKKFDDRIMIYALADKSVDILKYYHKDILKIIYNKNLEKKAREYKTIKGYIDSEARRIQRSIALDSPDFIKKKDKKEAKKYLNNLLEKQLKSAEKEGKILDEDQLFYIQDTMLQKIEMLTL